MARYHSFLVRVWCGADGEGEQLAGRVEHLQTAESRRFLSLEELMEQLRVQLGVRGTQRQEAHGEEGMGEAGAQGPP